MAEIKPLLPSYKDTLTPFNPSSLVSIIPSLSISAHTVEPILPQLINVTAMVAVAEQLEEDKTVKVYVPGIVVVAVLPD